ncbi:hypothetical protein ACFRAU_14635 [Arthrobacter sp. NPDC056691]|uniref:hypothetical protein n=1 Tax=Arthrobacter sp. NPDC056691 TaxID=3345913 RepID=UPI00366A7498
MGSAIKSDAGATPVIGRVAVGICAAADLTILGVLITNAASSSVASVLSAMAPPSGRLGLLAFGLGATVLLGLIFAVNSLTGPGSIFRRNDLNGLTEATPALPLLGLSFLLYWLGFSGVSCFAWRLNEPGSDMAAVSAAVTLVGAAALALWLIVVALGMRSPHSAERGTPEQP